MGIPVSLLNDLTAVPRDRRVTLILRHSARFPIIPPDPGFGVPLTEEGVRMAEALGVILGKRYACGRLAAAPVGRCLDTADAIARGAGWQAQAQADQRISHPFIEASWEVFYQGKMNGHLPRAVQTSLAYLLERPSDGPGIDIMATHDTVLGTLVGCLLHAEIHGEQWPDYLEGMFLWWDEDWSIARWRGTQRAFRVEQGVMVDRAG